MRIRDDIDKRDGVDAPSAIEAPIPVARASATQPEGVEQFDDEN